LSDKASKPRARRAQRIDDRLARSAVKNAERLAKLATGEKPGRARFRDARWMAGVAGLAAVGTFAGVSAARSIGKRDSADDPHATEDFTRLDADRASVVTTDDGVPLAVREVGPSDAPLTVVFAHGFCMCMGAYHFQRARLEEEWGDQVRMVFYDQRGHGQSGRAPIETYTVEQLGRDLENVLQVMVPRGPVVLVGHSMGGMTILSHARQFPEHYGSRVGSRVVGAALISSAAEGVARSPLGEILKNPALEAVRFATRYSPKLVHRARGSARSLIGPVLRTAAYGDENVSPSVVAFSEKMIHDTPIETMVEFLHALEVHDESAGVIVLAKVPTMIACGDRDLLTMVSSSRAMAVAMPRCELVIVPGAGHLVELERPQIIDDALVRLVERATPSKLVALTRRLKEKVRRSG
jgi:pimeloyl-ACP methyl ester carboxylesterase